jgi:glucose-1-phosphate thymidylyltransferase
MKAIIPAAGYATRLYPLTKDFPKALLDIQGQPILTHLIKKIEGMEHVDEACIVSNGKFHHHFLEWQDRHHFRLRITLLNDGTKSNDDRIGQIGDIQLAIDRQEINDDILVIAGDNLFNFSLLPVLDFFLQKQQVVNALYDVGSVDIASQLGTVTLDSSQKITSFKEKEPQPRTTLASLGIYLIPNEKVSLLKAYLDGGNPPDKMGFFMQWMITHHEVYGYIYKEKWFDIGWKDSLEEARREFTP